MTNETVLITGASSGIGLELARCFAADGSRLILLARRRGPLEALAAELLKAHRTQSEVFTLDLARPEAPERLWQHLEANGTRVDVLVNNAGFGTQGRFVELPLQRQLDMLQVNITALTHLTRLLLPGMIQRRRGGILNVASTAAFAPGPGMAVYYATKAFVLSLTEALAEEVAGTGLSVSALCPGSTATNFAAVANATNTNLLRRTAMSAAAVARLGHRAFRAGRVVAITGFRNQALAFSTRLAPRVTVRKIAGHLNAVRGGQEKTGSRIVLLL